MTNMSQKFAALQAGRTLNDLHARLQNIDGVQQDVFSYIEEISHNLATIENLTVGNIKPDVAAIKNQLESFLEDTYLNIASLYGITDGNIRPDIAAIKDALSGVRSDTMQIEQASNRTANNFDQLQPKIDSLLTTLNKLFGIENAIELIRDQITDDITPKLTSLVTNTGATALSAGTIAANTNTANTRLLDIYNRLAPVASITTIANLTSDLLAGQSISNGHLLTLAENSGNSLLVSGAILEAVNNINLNIGPVSADTTIFEELAGLGQILTTLAECCAAQLNGYDPVASCVNPVVSTGAERLNNASMFLNDTRLLWGSVPAEIQTTQWWLTFDTPSAWFLYVESNVGQFFTNPSASGRFPTNTWLNVAGLLTSESNLLVGIEGDGSLRGVLCRDVDMPEEPEEPEEPEDPPNFYACESAVEAYPVLSFRAIAVNEAYTVYEPVFDLTESAYLTELRNATTNNRYYTAHTSKTGWRMSVRIQWDVTASLYGVATPGGGTGDPSGNTAVGSSIAQNPSVSQGNMEKGYLTGTCSRSGGTVNNTFCALRIATTGAPPDPARFLVCIAGSQNTN